MRVTPALVSEAVLYAASVKAVARSLLTYQPQMEFQKIKQKKCSFLKKRTKRLLFPAPTPTIEAMAG